MVHKDLEGAILDFLGTLLSSFLLIFENWFSWMIIRRDPLLV
jgi:hypothetical protein